jgi:ABC-type phosphate transport system substrate-binding protein
MPAGLRTRDRAALETGFQMEAGMRKLTRLLAGVTTMVAAATLVAGTVTVASAAPNDPTKPSSLTTLAGVGSDTVTPLFDNSTAKLPKGDAPGSFVHDYNATKPGYPIASWDGTNPVTGIADQTIDTKALNSGDKSCDLSRPDGSSAGIEALNADQTDTHKVDGQTVYCIDYDRSSRPPNTTSNKDAFVALMRDAIDWSYPVVKGEANPQPQSLDKAQLVAIYTCKDTNWKQVGGKNAPIGVVIPQTGSGTRATWLLQLGITATDEPCWQNGTIKVRGVTYVIEENTGLSTGNVAQFTKTNKWPDGKVIPAADVIYPYSLGDWIAQDKLTKGVGGHATSIWGHGNMHLATILKVAPTSTNSKGQPIIDPKWDTAFDRVLYVVTRNGCYVSTRPTSTAVCLPSSKPPAGGTAYPTYEVKGLAAFAGRTGWVCTNKTALADIVSYGFARLPNCGALTAGD